MKAVVESPSPPRGQEWVRVHPEQLRVVGCRYVNGEFVRGEVLTKRERRKRLHNVQIRRIVWCYHDFGYGNSLSHVSRETVRWLKRAGIPVMMRPWDERTWPELGVPVAGSEDLRESAVILMDRYPVAPHVWEMLKEAPFVAGYYMVEGTRARGVEVDRLEGYDAIFTPTSFCRKALQDSGLLTPVFVWGHGFDHEMLPYVPPRRGRPFTFLWFGDENRRKGYDIFLDAFSRVKAPGVRAWVRGPGSGNVAHLRERYKGDSRIVWDTRVTPPETLKDLMGEGDVLVAPLRGEGFGLTLLEAMAAGRAVIATRWSGPVDFGSEDTVYWLEPRGTEPAQNDEGIQRVPSVDDVVERMEWCARNPEEVWERGKRAHEKAHREWRWEKKVLEVLPALRSLIPNFSL